MTVQTDNQTGRPAQRDGPILDRSEKRTLRAFILTGIAAIGVLAGFRFARRAVRGAVHDAATSRSDDTSSPENAAQRIYNAFFPDTPWGWGTDEKLLRDTVRALPHREFWEDVKRAYSRITQDTGTKGRSLMDDLRAELSVQMQREVELILQQLPRNARDARNQTGQVTQGQLRAWAERMKQAADYESSWIWPYGTDEDAVQAVLQELPTVRDFCQLNSIYQQLYGSTLVAMMMDEMSGEDLLAAHRIITQKPDANGRTIEQIIRQCT